MQCPKCNYELKWFALMRTQKLVCPDCKARLEPAPMRAPFVMILLAMLPVQIGNLFRSYHFSPGRGTLVVLAVTYLAAWIALLALGIHELRKPGLRERARPEPETVLNLHFGSQDGGSSQ